MESDNYSAFHVPSTPVGFTGAGSSVPFDPDRSKAVEYAYSLILLRALTIPVAVLLVGLLYKSNVVSKSNGRAASSDPEPPLAPMSFPLFNHIISLIRFGPSAFLQNLRKYSDKGGFYTVLLGFNPLTAQRIYAFDHATDLKTIYYNDKAFTWRPLAIRFLKPFMGNKHADEKLIGDSLNDPHSWYSKLANKNELLATSGKGGYLDEINERAKPIWAEEMTKLLQKEQKVELDSLMERVFFRVSLGMYFGSGNLYDNAKTPEESDRLLQNYMTWERNAVQLTSPGINLYNRIFHRKAVQARDDLVAAHVEYLKDPERIKDAMGMIHERMRMCLDAGTSLDCSARQDMTLLFGSMNNVRGATYWTIYRAFSNPQIHSDIAAELASTKAVRTDTDENTGESVGVIDMPALVQNSKYLRALFHEVLRHYQDTISMRLVKDDLSLRLSDGKKYRLKKDSVLLVSGANLCFDRETWGTDVDDFNPYRFIRPGTSEEKKLQADGFKPFGGGQTLCPGRKLAFSECAGVLAALIAFFDVKVPETPPKRKPRDAFGVLYSSEACLVDIIPKGTVSRITYKW